MIRLLKIHGKSLEPRYHEGDFVLVSKIPFLMRGPRPGDTVVFRHPRYGTLIKQVERVTAGGELYVTGASPSSIDSDSFGTVSPGWLVGKVIARVRKPV